MKNNTRLPEWASDMQAEIESILLKYGQMAVQSKTPKATTETAFMFTLAMAMTSITGHGRDGKAVFSLQTALDKTLDIRRRAGGL